MRCAQLGTSCSSSSGFPPTPPSPSAQVINQASIQIIEQAASSYPFTIIAFPSRDYSNLVQADRAADHTALPILPPVQLPAMSSMPVYNARAAAGDEIQIIPGLLCTGYHTIEPLKDAPAILVSCLYADHI